MRDQNDVTISSHRFGELAISAIRYALGRRTGLPEDIANDVRLQVKRLSCKDLTVVRRDVAEYIARNSKQPDGMLPDLSMPAWQKLFDAVQRELRDRLEKGGAT